MKQKIKTILLIFTMALVVTSCSDSEDSNPPKAGFTLSSTDLIRWDSATISNSSFSSIETESLTYTVTGGAYEMENNSIQFLDSGSYTITQTIKNADGSDSTKITVDVAAPKNAYTLDDEELAIGTTDQPNVYWYDGTSQGGTLYLRMLGNVSGQDNPNLIKLLPVAGPNPIQANYTWSDSGDIGTYDVGMTANYAGFSYDWTTDGDKGENLSIKLIYKASSSANNIYEITLPSYTLNYGNYNWGAGTFDIDGTKELSIFYRGKIDPSN
ncbi:hypothetical protein [Gelidibacter sp.]|uniref:hypothetical protein n=1 Tax=Gelidibacter sp. TaxID=2018083 RepID=UPI002BBBD268|nr:hypothetical protein [Gelidibacter sp.]HUH28572.1 hypothetical protein [Gelidibacter sp.]